MQHRAVVEKKDQGFGLVPLGRIEIELRRRIQNGLSNCGGDAAASIQNPGDCSKAYVSGGCYLSKSQLSLLNGRVSHAAKLSLLGWF